MAAFLEYSSYDSMNRRPASSLREDSGNGTKRRHQITLRTWARPMLGFQSFLSALTQISPAVDTLGWNIFVKKKPRGGDDGYEESMTSFTRKRPPTKGVSSGPSNSAYTSLTMSSSRGTNLVDSTREPMVRAMESKTGKLRAGDRTDQTATSTAHTNTHAPNSSRRRLRQVGYLAHQNTQRCRWKPTERHGESVPFLLVVVERFLASSVTAGIVTTWA